MGTKELQAKIKELKELKLLAEELDAEITATEDTIKAHMGAQEELIAGEYKIRWTFVKYSRFDSTALKAVNPSLYSQFLKTTETRRFSVA